MSAANSFGTAADYAPLLKGDHGFLFAIALTVLVILVISFVTKLHFTWRRFAAISRDGRFTCHEVLAADAMWLFAHFLAFAYLGVRIATLNGFTEDSESLSRHQKAGLGKEDQTARILFMLTLYLSCCSVLCTDLAIRNVSRGAPSKLKSATYGAPLVVFIAGLLLCTLPLIGCNSQHVFHDHHHHCRLSPARVLPSMIVIILLDTAVVVHWASFAFRRSSKFSVGQVTRREPWPVVPFMLRLFIVGANIAYLVFYTRATTIDSVPYHSVFYPELLAVLMSLSATTSVSMSKVLAKFNFAGIAYAENPTFRSRDLSAPSGRGTLTSYNAKSLRRTRSATGMLLSGDMTEWRHPSEVSMPSLSNPSVKAGRNESIDSDIPSLPIAGMVEAHQDWDTSDTVVHGDARKEEV